MAGAAHADPLVDRIVEQLEASPSGCSAVAPGNPRRKTMEADIARFETLAPVPQDVQFEVKDCEVDGFVHKGQTIVVSVRLTRLPPSQRFFILAHELGHIQLQHHAAVSSFVAAAVSGAADEAAARAAVASGLSAVSHRNELAADAYAVRLMQQAGYDPLDAARLFDRIGTTQDNATHPSARRRAGAIRALL
ncbi:MAG TPA: M48 family metalloprotease [Albitalea sp.]|nr:M48 family metalloprotease [Albitalea sp.]